MSYLQWILLTKLMVRFTINIRGESILPLYFGRIHNNFTTDFR